MDPDESMGVALLIRYAVVLQEVEQILLCDIFQQGMAQSKSIF